MSVFNLQTKGYPYKLGDRSAPMSGCCLPAPAVRYPLYLPPISYSSLKTSHFYIVYLVCYTLTSVNSSMLFLEDRTGQLQTVSSGLD